MADELRPCPFCGGEATIAEDSGRRGEVFSVWHQCQNDGGRFNRYGSVDALTIDTGWYDTREQAIAAWNRRAERTARLEYDEIHGCNICTGCGERYEYDKYISLTDDYLIAFKPMRYCPNCGVRFKEDDDGNE